MVRPTSPAHAPRSDPLPHWSLPPPRSQPTHLASGRAARSRAISGRAARSRAISRYLGAPRHAAPPPPPPPTPPPHPPPHPPPRRAVSGDLGASLARRHTCSKKRKGPVGATGLTCSLGSRRSLCATFEALARAGEAAPRAARSSPSTPTPARTAHLQPSWGYSRAHAGPGGLPSPHLRRVRSVLRPFGACVHVPRARLPGLMPRPNQQHARLMPRPNNCLAGAKAQ